MNYFSRSNPAGKSYASIAPISVTSISYQILSGDYLIVVDTGGVTITLPASPNDGDSYEVKSLAATSITVSGIDIDGSPTEELIQYDSRVYTYVTSLAMWVRR